MSPLPLAATLLALCAQDPLGTWTGRLASGGEPIAFGLELARAADGTLDAVLINAEERIPVPEVHWDGATLVIAMPHYDSRITARRDGERLSGTWEKRRGKGELAAVQFEAERPGTTPAPADSTTRRSPFSGRWSVKFEGDELPAVAIFEDVGPASLRGTFLTATGDYRYLGGRWSADGLVLSCFDGAHAFAFRATKEADGSLAGEFWSGNWHHERWSARFDPRAALEAPLGQVVWNEDVTLADLAFTDLEGETRVLAAPGLAGRATLLVLLGSWCPNCHDEARLLAELEREYRGRGLAILGLAFELTGELERDAAQVRLFAERHGLTFPIFLAGTADKGRATQALGALDRVRAFPTTVFFGVDGRARGLHSGFAGPATGAEHEQLRREFRARIEVLLAEPAPSDAALRSALRSSTWVSSESPGATLVFSEDVLRAHVLSSEDAGEPVTLVADAVWIGARCWRFDREAGVLLDPTDFGVRLHPQDAPTPLLARRGFGADPAGAKRALPDEDPRLRREALVALALARARTGQRGLPEALPLFDDDALAVRLAATWAVGYCREDARALLLPQLEHGNAALRRETLRALLALGLGADELRGHVQPLEHDLEPYVRETVRGLLARGR